MLEISYTWLETVIDVSTKSLLLAVIAGAALVVFRVRDVNFRHRVWTAVLAGMLVMPLLILVTPSVPLPGWMAVSLQPPPPAEHDAQAPPPPEPADAASAANTVGRDSLISTVPVPQEAAASFDPFASPINDVQGVQPFEHKSPLAAPPFLEVVEAEPIAALPPVDERPPAVRGASRPWLAMHWPLVVAATYVFVLAGLLIRFAVGLWLTSRLVRQSRPVDPYTGTSVGRIANPSYKCVRLLEHPQAYVPLTFGFLRPAVLLPAAWRTWSGEKLHAVLAHELAHVRRRDWFVTMLAELNRAVYWFHPLAWFLKRRLSALAEQSCDDAVLEANTDRAEYARYLLEVAASLTASGRRCRAPLSSVAMARVPSVETRIDAILDPGRPLARRLGAIGVAVLLAVGIPAIILAAALRPADGEAKPDPPPATEVKDATELESTDAPESTKANTAAEDQDEALKHIEGRVVGPDGNPVSGARVYAAWTLDKGLYAYSHDVMAETSTGANGDFHLTFSIERPAHDRVHQGWQVVAHADNLGPAWIRDVHLLENPSPTLELTPDQPIQIRVLDLEGEPLAGVTAKVRVLHPSDGDEAIREWIRETKGKQAPPELEDYFFNSSGQLPGRFPTTWNNGQLMHGAPGMSEDAVTDADGRLQFEGLGANRLALVELSGPGIVKTLLHVVTRDMEVVLAQPVEMRGTRSGTYYGSNFEFVAEPAQPIVGTVKDADSGEPLANVKVQLGQLAGNTFSQGGFLTTRTDEAGRYRLDGAPQGRGHRIDVEPEVDAPFFPTRKEIETASGFEPVVCDFELKQGIWVRGKVIEKESDIPIANATIQCLPLRTNKHAEDYINFDPRITGSSPSGRYRTSDDGSFRVLAIPGGSVLTAIAQREHAYRYVNLDPEQLPERLRTDDNNFNTYHPWVITGTHTYREVDIPESADAVSYDLQMTVGLTRRITLIDQDGQPVSGVRVLGRIFPPRLEQPLDEATVEIIGLRPDENRIVAFVHPERKIGRMLLLSTGDETQVELIPCATIRGRVVDNDAEPMKDVRIETSINNDVVGDNWHRGLDAVRTDVDGRFELLLPTGLESHVSTYSPPLGPNFSAECDPKPGNVIDLGDITHGAKLDLEDTAKLTVAKQAASQRPAALARQSASSGAESLTANLESTSDDLIAIRGRVVTPDGHPAENARVFALRWHWSHRVDRQPLASTRSNVNGSFELAFRKSEFDVDIGKPDQWKETAFVATAEGFGFGYQNLRDLAPGEEVRLELVPDEPLVGQIVDLEGRPVASAAVSVFRVDRPVVGTTDAFVEAVRGGEIVPDAFRTHLGSMLQVDSLPEFQPIQTDEQGRFRITGIGAERVAYLQVTGPAIAATELVAVTRPMEAVVRRLRREAGTNAEGHLYGAQIDFVAPPARVLEGKVRDAKSGDPLAGVTIRASGLSQSIIESHTDEDGRYRLSGLPKRESLSVAFIGSPEEPYFNRDVEVPSSPGLEPIHLDVSLHRGVWITGRVMDAQTGDGVQAHAEYVPFLDNPHAAAIRQFNRAEGSRSYDFMFGDRTSRSNPSAGDGTFRIVGLPGHGVLSVRALSSTEYKLGVGADRLHGVRGDEEVARVPTPIGPELNNETREIWHEIEPEPATYEFRLERAVETANTQNANGPQANPKPEITNPQSTSVPADKQAPLVYEGQVLTPDGKPAAGAKLHLVYWYSDADSPGKQNPVATTDADGRFHFEMPRSDFHRTSDTVPPWQWASLVAVADGYGMAWASSLAFEKTGAALEELRDPGHPNPGGYERAKAVIEQQRGPLRLAADVPIRAKIVDTEGEPIEGARVSLLEVFTGADDTLAAWHAAAAGPRADFNSLRNEVLKHLRGSLVQALVSPVVTDDGGQFAMDGIGRERIVRLLIEAPHIESADVYCRTRPGERIEVASGRMDERMAIEGAEFAHVAVPSKPVMGVVRDSHTGEPIAGVSVSSNRIWMSTAPGKEEEVGNEFSRATTDEHGRYELTGLPRAERNPIQFMPASTTAFLPQGASADTRGSDVDPVKVDAQLDRGVVVTGRVVDAETGRGVSGRLAYLAARDEPNALRLPKLPTMAALRDVIRSDTNGDFRIVVPRRRGYLGFMAFDDTYEKKSAHPADAAAGGGPGLTLTYFYAGGGPGISYHALAELDLAEDDARHEVRLEVRRAPIVTGIIVDPQEKPLMGGFYSGRNESNQWRPIADGQFVVANYDPASPRRLAFMHRERKLAGTHLVAGDVEGQVRVQLQPWGTVTGRVVDEAGDAVAGMVLRSGNMASMMPVMPSPDASRIEQPTLPLPPADGDPTSPLFTDENGRFTIDGLVPGHPYDLFGYSQGGFERQLQGDLAQGVVLDAGQTLDLGDVKVVPPDYEALRREFEKRAEEATRKAGSDENEKVPARNAAANDDVSAVAPQEKNAAERIEGRVVAEGQRLPSGVRLFKLRGHLGNREFDVDELAASAIEQDGSFVVSMENVERLHDGNLPLDRWVDAGLYATAPGHGLAWWFATGEFDASQPVTLDLVRDDLPIRGRVVDTEGSPVAGAAVQIQTIAAPSAGEISDWLKAKRENASPWQLSRLMERLHLRASGISPEMELVQSVTTESDGTFVLKGIGRERVVTLSVEGQSFERSEFHVATRDMPRLDLPDESPIHGATSTFVVRQGLVIVGVVRDAATREPLAGVTVRDSMLDNTAGAYESTFEATTDADGRYRVAGFPATGENRLMAVPNDEQPYFMREASVEPSETPGNHVVRLDFDLHRGLWITGRVTEAESGKPVKAKLHYLPFLANRYAQDLPGFGGNANGFTHFSHLQHRYQTEADGMFRLVGLPGRSIVGVDGYGEFCVGVGADEIEGLDREGKFATYRNPLLPGRHWPHAMKEIHPEEGKQEVQVDFVLKRGARQTVRVVDADGNPLAGAHIGGAGPSAGFALDKHHEAVFDVHGLGPRDTRKLFIQHREKNLAAVATVDMQAERPATMEVRLTPGATIRGQLVDRDGEPMRSTGIEARTQLGEYVVRLESIMTDEDGAFQIDAVPGPADYELRLIRTESRLPDEARRLTIEAGETRDLGMIQVVR